MEPQISSSHVKGCFTLMEEYHYVYIKYSNISFIILTLYVDDVLIVGNHNKLIKVT